MASLAATEQRFNFLKNQYDTYIKDKNATVYEEALICSTDSEFISYLDRIKGQIDVFKAEVSNITPPDNYNKTWGYMDEINSKSQYGYTQIVAYRNSVENKSKEVFQEYLDDFNSKNSSYETAVQRAGTLLKKARNADSLAKQYAANATNANRSAFTTSTTDWGALASEQEKKRDSYIKSIWSYSFTNMESCIEQLFEILNKGLRKG